MDVLLDEAELGPEGEVGERGVEAELRLDDGADADVGAEVRVEVGRVARAGGAPVARLQDHHPTGLLQNSMQSENVIYALEESDIFVVISCKNIDIQRCKNWRKLV